MQAPGGICRESALLTKNGRGDKVGFCFILVRRPGFGRKGRELNESDSGP
jgi:hypothetical protein